VVRETLVGTRAGLTADASLLFRVFFIGLFLESVCQWAEVSRLIGVA
jgi:hypothetical protein